MKDLTLRQVAAISCVTVRRLHHHAEIGLLAPAISERMVIATLAGPISISRILIS
jgi:hypothetical protein